MPWRYAAHFCGSASSIAETCSGVWTDGVRTRRIHDIHAVLLIPRPFYRHILASSDQCEKCVCLPPRKPSPEQWFSIDRAFLRKYLLGSGELFQSNSTGIAPGSETDPVDPRPRPLRRRTTRSRGTIYIILAPAP